MACASVEISRGIAVPGVRLVRVQLLTLSAWLSICVGQTTKADEQNERIANQLAGVVLDVKADVRVRVQAARTLSQLGPQAAVVVPHLERQLKRLQGDELEPLQEAVIEALSAMGAGAKPALPTLATLSGRTLDIDLAVKRATKEIVAADDGGDVRLLIRQLSSRDPSLRVRAAKGLGERREEARIAVPELTVALSDSDGDVRRAAASALRRIQPAVATSKEMIAVLIMDLQDPDDDVRLLAARTLGRLGASAVDALPELEKLLNDPDRDVRKMAGEAMIRITNP